MPGGKLPPTICLRDHAVLAGLKQQIALTAFTVMKSKLPRGATAKRIHLASLESDILPLCRKLGSCKNPLCKKTHEFSYPVWIGLTIQEVAIKKMLFGLLAFACFCFILNKECVALAWHGPVKVRPVQIRRNFTNP